MYSDAVNTASCTAWIDCQPGTEVDAEGTPTTDRTCLACTGTTQTTTVNAPTCLPQGACAAGFITVTEATTEADAVCDDSTCVAGTFCAGGLADVVACPTGTFDHDLSAATACQNHTPCTLATQVQTAVGDATNDYACDPRTVCNPGQESTNEGSLDITTDRTCADCPIGEFTTTINSSCVALIDCDPGSFVANSADISNQDVDRSCVACTPGTDYSDTTNAPSCTDVDPCATGFSATALSTTQADQTCLANSCKVLFDNGTTDDGVNAISVNNTPVDVYCEMTSQGGGWTRAVIISGNSSFHIEQVGEVGDFAAVPNGDGFDAKMSDAMINSISNAEGSPGFWRLKCGGRDIGVTNTNKVWTSLATNTEAWSLDMADDFASLFDGEYECAASRTGYTFSSGEHTLSTCRDAHLNYGDGVTTETGCYQQTISGIGSDGTWGAGTLWIR